LENGAPEVEIVTGNKKFWVLFTICNTLYVTNLSENLQSTKRTGQETKVQGFYVQF